jgi:hypothetical protein
MAAIDASDEEPERIRIWLRTVPLTGRVYALWMGLGEGLECEYEDFISYYDNLWCPASDDIWIINSAGAILLEMNHEEQFSWIGEVI